jgi:hypothetical protein
MRRVLHLKMVSQCAMLEDFGIFLVLADKVRRCDFLITKSRPYISIAVTVCIPHRGACAVVTS